MRLSQHDVQLLKTLKAARKELDYAKRAFAQDAVIVQSTKNQVIQDRDLWSILFITAGGAEGDMGLVERSTVTLKRIDHFFPKIEAKFVQNAKTMKEGVQALKTFRNEIRVYRRMYQQLRVEEPQLALIRDSAQALDRTNEETESKAMEVAKHKEERQELFSGRYH